MKILISGGSGLVGRNISLYLTGKGDITILTRDISKIKKNDSLKYITRLDKGDYFDVVINLSGARLNKKRWSKEFKNELHQSRVGVTKNLYESIKLMEKKPLTYISASAIGIYGSDESRVFDENTIKDDSSFSQKLCLEWEREARKFEDLGCRVSILRFGVILSNEDGFLKEILLPFKLGLGAIMGDGNQFFSWIHVKDLVSAIKFIIDNKLEGAYNLTSPNSVTNKEFSASLAKTLSRPLLFKFPKWLIKIIFGQMGEELILSSTNVFPRKLINNGFKFEFANIDHALEDLFK
jgi:uncharacterized protein (TIGR01777 family)